MKWNARIRNTRKGLQSQMIRAPQEGKVCRNPHASPRIPRHLSESLDSRFGRP